ncbi:MAG: MBL fold metallo-hydrolase [Muribaculaceae bacterium]|nr:MBL fold metallo-hydrolase [Muribaculaceae bacterium]
MKKTLTYIWHDCFVYRSQKCVIVFDYWCNPHKPYNLDGRSFDEFLSEAVLSDNGSILPVYFIVSHHHKDHFNKHIFAWGHHLPRVHYIVSKDVERAVKYLWKPESTYTGPLRVTPEMVTTMRVGDNYSDELVSVHAFGSTDIGNSYVIEVDGIRFFHAGDLNAWIWKDESTPREVADAIREFEFKLEDIAEKFESFDVAMFPVDARIGRDWWEGAFRFVHRFDVELFIPMHFSLYETDIQRIDFIRKATDFALYANPMRGNYCALTQPYQHLLLDK